ncbi:hypothetical protein, partial [Bacillus cereus]|uniref:hypothetical protein n=1 Tax=Bacillus cereus TaxID=1396 RepID=UPI0036702430
MQKLVSVLITYRSIIASILLALHVFVAVPVMYRHHHDPASGGSAIVALPKGKVIHITKERCAICEYQYPVYEENTPFYWHSR